MPDFAPSIEAANQHNANPNTMKRIPAASPLSTAMRNPAHATPMSANVMPRRGRGRHAGQQAFEHPETIPSAAPMTRDQICLANFAACR